MTRQEAADRFAKAYCNPLQIPLFETELLDRLFVQFAPVWKIDTRNETDKIGTVTLDADGKPSIDTEKPTVYVKHAYTRFHDENLLQLIYQVWMLARKKTGTFDLYGGKLDSVIWRVTLSSKGYRSPTTAFMPASVITNCFRQKASSHYQTQTERKPCYRRIE
ncbi:hypothetical protein [Methylotuvimicrobium sp. KM1]|uniref:hypothetical protein n=1 Tax=Methylotuvimicrobium sp. KM1 TaxID=3377707 RepID=UPI00384D5EBB